MKNLIGIICSLLFVIACSKPNIEQKIVHSDIEHFWNAYDSIQTTQDSIQQVEFLNKLFLQKASAGQKSMIEVRNYTPTQYLNAINDFPLFWKSIRSNTVETEQYKTELLEGIQKLKAIYPDLKASTIYYTMGVFRSPGTGFDSLVLIGSEFALGDKNTVTSEFPERMNHIKSYYQTDPTQHIQFLNVHEYVHTQQNEIVNNLLSQCLYEGIAEFVTIKATGKKSPWPALVYGPKNHEKVRAQFEEDLFNVRKRGNWLWNNTNNPFQTADMGYYVGHVMAERYYENASDKKLAIKELIELDYNDEKAIEDFVHGVNYLSAPLDTLYNRFEKKRPVVINIKEFKNKSQEVDPSISSITIELSKPLDPRFKSTGLGELGRDHFPKVSAINIAEDGLSIRYDVVLEANKRYQLLLENGYRTSDEIPLKAFLIDFKTGS